jgi:hypothetical protein
VPQEARPEWADAALIQAIVELKSRKPRFGCPGWRGSSRRRRNDVDKNVVYRVLSKH